MSYQAIKCWFCGKVPHPLDVGHAVWCARIYQQRAKGGDVDAGGAA